MKRCDSYEESNRICAKCIPKQSVDLLLKTSLRAEFVSLKISLRGEFVSLKYSTHASPHLCFEPR